MPTDDPRLEQALHDAAPVVETTGVLDRGHAPPHPSAPPPPARHRRARRSSRSSWSVTITVLVTRDDGSSPQVAAPGHGCPRTW